MMVKLFICSLATILIYLQNANATIVGPQKNLAADIYEEEEGEVKTIIPAKFKQKYGMKKSLPAPKASSNSYNESENSANTADNDTSLNNTDASSNNKKENCQEDENKILFCVDGEGKPLNGKQVSFGPGGHYASVEYFRNGYYNGLCTYYNDEGKKKESIFYRMGVKSGEYKAYYKTEGIAIWANYKSGLLNGNVDITNPSGRLLGRMNYKNGVLDKGFCTRNGKRETFSDEMIKSYPFNTLNNCGVEL